MILRWNNNISRVLIYIDQKLFCNYLHFYRTLLQLFQSLQIDQVSYGLVTENIYEFHCPPVIKNYRLRVWKTDIVFPNNELMCLLFELKIIFTCCHNRRIFRPRSSLQFGRASVWLKTTDLGSLKLFHTNLPVFIHWETKLNFKFTWQVCVINATYPIFRFVGGFVGDGLGVGTSNHHPGFFVWPRAGGIRSLAVSNVTYPNIVSG